MTEVMTASQYLAEVGKPKQQSASEKTARAFHFQIRARRLPEPMWKFGPGGELRFAAEHTDIPRENRKRRRHVSAPPKAPAWRFDFAWPEQRIAVEVEGIDVFRDPVSKQMRTRGRHTTPEGFNDDCEKYAWAHVLGWHPLRFTPKQVKSGFAIDMLVRMFAAVAVPRVLPSELPPETIAALARQVPQLEPIEQRPLFKLDKPPF